MKNKHFLLAVIMVTAIPTTVSAQLKVSSDGNVTIQKTTTDSDVRLDVGYVPAYNAMSLDAHKIGIHSQEYASPQSTMCIGVFGEARKNSTNQTTSEHSIGVWGYAGGAASNRNIGVLGSVPPNEYGIAVQGSTEGGPWYQAQGWYAGYFYGPTNVDGELTVNSFYNLSDIRLKEDVVSLSAAESPNGKALDKLGEIDVIEYNLKPIHQVKDVTDGSTGNLRQLYRQREKERRHFGVSAQELQKIYPDLVMEGQNGYLAVNYTELVPILIRSIQELKQELDEVRGAEAAPARSAAAAIRTATAANGNVLYQNTPNPFKEKTTIRFSLASGAQNAAICIFDMTGKMLKRLPVMQGESSVSVNGYELGEGMFLYSLLVNGQEVDTKRMIITK